VAGACSAVSYRCKNSPVLRSFGAQIKRGKREKKSGWRAAKVTVTEKTWVVSPEPGVLDLDILENPRESIRGQR